MQITFAVPKETTSCFVIAVDRDPTDLSSVVPWRISGPHRREAAAALGSPRLAITPHGPSHVIVSSTASPSRQPKSVQAARAAARAVAEAYGGIIDDPLTGNLITNEFGGMEEPPTFRLADDWLGWQVEIAKDAACPHTGDRPSSCTPLSVSTRGLCRFGMPEITLDGTACAHSRRPIDFLRVVAQRLLTEHLSWLSANPSTGVRAICDHLRIDGANFAAPGGLPRSTPDARAETNPAAEPPVLTDPESAPAVDDGPLVTADGPQRAVPGDGRRPDGAVGDGTAVDKAAVDGAEVGEAVVHRAGAGSAEGGRASGRRAGNRCTTGGEFTPADLGFERRRSGEANRRRASPAGAWGYRGPEHGGQGRGRPDHRGTDGRGADYPAPGNGALGNGGAAYGARRFVLVRLSRDRDCLGEGRLKVGPPVGFDGGLDDWLCLAFEESASGRRGFEPSGGMNLRAA